MTDSGQSQTNEPALQLPVLNNESGALRAGSENEKTEAARPVTTKSSIGSADLSQRNPHRLADWRGEGLRYFAYNFYLRQKFGARVQKVSIDAGFTCPNVDGTVAKGGCVFCDNRSFSPSRRIAKQQVLDQIEDGVGKLKRRYGCDHFMAYFQPATNTYAPVEQLRPLYETALSHPKVVGMAVGTRPDCVPDEVLDLLEEIASQSYLSVEYGMQTMHDRSLEWMNRGHDHDSFLDAMERSRGRGFEICAHVMLGLPGETREDMLATAKELAAVEIDAVKVHNLYCVKDTPLETQVRNGEVTLMGQEEYIETLVEFLELIPPTTIVERISGDAPPNYFVGPQWCLDKPGVRAAVAAEFEKRDTYQGRLFKKS